MTRARGGMIVLLCGVLGTSMLSAEDLSSYRGLKLGMSLAVAAKQTGTKSSDARVVHQHPAVIQEMNWELRSPIQTNTAKPDPVKDGLLSFVADV